MDCWPIIERVSKFIRDRNLQGAEDFLLKELSKPDIQADAEAKLLLISELITIYCVSGDPLCWIKAEALSTEREQLAPSAFSKLQTAEFLYRTIEDYGRAIIKFEEAIAQGKDERDDMTVYTALNVLGEAYLHLEDTKKALLMFDEVEGMIARKPAVVVGDETTFLEKLLARGLEKERVMRLAAILAPVCRDPEFKKRLGKLTSRQ